MKLPKVVKIGGVDWKLNWSVPSDGEEHADKFGETRYGASEIWVHPGQSPSMIPSTILHELIHAILLNAGMANREPIVRALEVGLGQVLRDNKWLAEWLKNGRVA